MSISVFTTGGTIDKGDFDAKGGYQVGAPMVLELLRHARLPTLPQVTELLREDGLEMSVADRQAVRTSRDALLSSPCSCLPLPQHRGRRGRRFKPAPAASALLQRSRSCGPSWCPCTMPPAGFTGIAAKSSAPRSARRCAWRWKASRVRAPPAG